MEKQEQLRLANETYQMIQDINVKGKDAITMAHVLSRMGTLLQGIAEDCNVPVQMVDE